MLRAGGKENLPDSATYDNYSLHPKLSQQTVQIILFRALQVVKQAYARVEASKAVRGLIVSIIVGIEAFVRAVYQLYGYLVRVKAAEEA